MPKSKALTIKIINVRKIVNHRLTVLVYLYKQYLSITEKPPTKAAWFIHETFGKIGQHRTFINHFPTTPISGADHCVNSILILFASFVDD